MENKPMKLLLIEDDEEECNRYKEITSKREDVNIIAVTNSESEALELVTTHTPDGIILDLELTNGSGTGFDFLEKLKTLKLKNRPRIVVTTNVYSDSVYEYLHKTKVDFIFYKKQENFSREIVLNTLLLLKGFNNNINKKQIKKDDTTRRRQSS